ncbi:hypothetical protein IFM89_007155 [Coptis chinensis]|uniref:KIB1-4 beta-propeller domain-containing protein n=1 Tax=Coptis chinensis TaxID=261450 RepID=A0A835HD69_9MAGN|nr:hypothetical protein IFM89_007155 [Coptis chinensis]
MVKIIARSGHALVYWRVENRVREQSVPEASGRYLYGSFDDWLIVAELLYSKVEFFFWNRFSRTKKLLMPLAWDVYHRMLVSASPNDPNCVVLLLASYSERFACWAPGLDNWHGVFMGEDAFVDAVFCNGLFYFVSSENNIYTIDSEAMISPMKEKDIHGGTRNNQLLRDCLRLHQVAMPVKPTRACMRRYLVESCGEVLLVCRLFWRGDGKFLTSRGFEVFKLDACQMIWVKMESLGDRILFVGRAGSRSFSAAELGSDIGNRIYFVNDEMHLLQQGTEWEDSSPKHC